MTPKRNPTKARTRVEPTRHVRETGRVAFAQELALVKHKAGTMGLFRTMRALDEAVKVVGYEIADGMRLISTAPSKGKGR